MTFAFSGNKLCFNDCKGLLRVVGVGDRVCVDTGVNSCEGVISLVLRDSLVLNYGDAMRVVDYNEISNLSAISHCY